MVLAMNVNAIGMIVDYMAIIFYLTQTEFYAYAISTSADTLIHWMFCNTYLKLYIEVKYLFDQRIYTNDQSVILEINRHSFCLKIAHVINIAICLGILIYGIVVKTDKAYTILWSLATVL
jgi:hypothetical protein